MREIPRNNQIKEKSKIALGTSEKIETAEKSKSTRDTTKQSNNGEILDCARY